MLRWIRLWTAALLAELPRAAAVGVLVLVTALVTAAVPRVIGRASDDALRGELTGAPPASRDLELVQDGRIPATGSPSATDPLGPVVAARTALQAQYPAPIGSVVSGTGLAIDTPHWRTTAGNQLTAVLRLRVQQDVEGHLTLVAGRRPTAATVLVPDPTTGAPPGSMVEVLEAWVAVPSANALAATVGDRLVLDPEPSDPLAAHRSVRVAIDIVGTYRVTDPGDPFWIDDAEVGQPGIYALQGFTEYVSAMALLSPDAYPALLDVTGIARMPLLYRFRSYVDAMAVDATEVDALAAAVRRARSLFPSSSDVPVIREKGVAPATLHTGLLTLLDSHITRWATAAGVLAAAWVGVLLAILASVVLVAEGTARVGRPAMAIVRDRGASRSQTMLAAVAEALILVLPGALAGTALAVVLVPVRDPAPTVAVAGAVACATVLLMAAATLRTDATAAANQQERRGGTARRTATVAVVVVAAAGTVLLRQPVVAGAAGTPLASDAVLAAVPALIGLAAALLLAAAVRPIAGAAAVRAAGRRGAAAVLGLRRAAGSGAALLIVALATTGVLTFATSVAERIETGSAWASWQSVGADAAVVGPPQSIRALLTSPPTGVEAVASIATVPVTVTGLGQLTAIIVDPAAAGAVTAGTAAQVAYPAAMLSTSTGPLAVLASADVLAGASGAASPSPAARASASAATSTPTASGAVSAGQTFTVKLGTKDVTVSVAGELDAFPGVPVEGPFIVVPAGQLQAQGAQVPAPTLGLVRAPAPAIERIRAAVASDPALSGLTVTERSKAGAGLLAAPAASAVVAGLRIGAVAVLPYGLLAIIIAVALAADARHPETARARVLGMSRRQSIAAALVESLPAVLAGGIAGVVLGPVVLAVTDPGLGLGAVVGVARLGPSPGLPAAAAVGLAAALVLAAAVALVCVLVDQRPTLSEVLRE